MPKKSDPCWKGYEQVGNKQKGGKSVPNCVPKKDSKPAAPKPKAKPKKK